MSKQFDFFGDENSSNNTQPTKKTSNPGSQTVKGFDVSSMGVASPSKKNSNNKKPKNVKKAVFISLAVLALGGSVAGFMVYQNHQKQLAVQQSQENANFKKLQASVQSAVSDYSVYDLSVSNKEGVSVWDLNKNYVSSSKAKLNFLTTVGKQIKVSLTKGSSDVKVTIPNWEYVNWIIKNADNSKITTGVSDLDVNSASFNNDLVTKYAGYIGTQLPDMLSYKGDYVQSYIQADNVPKPYKEITIKNAVSDGKLTSDFSSELDKNVFSDEFRQTIDTFYNVATGKYGEAKENEEHAKWKHSLDELDSYIEKLKTTVGEESSTPSSSETATSESGKSEASSETQPEGKSSSETATSEASSEQPASETAQSSTSGSSTSDKQGGVSGYSWDSSNQTVKSALESRKELLKIEPIPYTFTNSSAKPKKVLEHGWVGYSFIHSKKSDKVSSDVPTGDGSYDKPFTLGTSFDTKALGTDGEYHDVRVTVTGIKVGKDAIKDAVTYDQRNQGFTTESSMVLTTFKFKVENLSDKEVEINSEFTLSDKDLNLTSRTGNMYSFPERKTLKPHETVDMADWAYAKDTETLCLVWGKTFNRKYPAYFINVLGDEVYDKYGRPVDRKTKKVLDNKAQKDFDNIKKEVDSEKW